MIVTRVSASPPARRVPVSLDHIAHRTNERWSLEPPVPEARRTELLAELSELYADLEATQIRVAADVEIYPTEIRRCAQWYLWLRREWRSGEVAA